MRWNRGPARSDYEQTLDALETALDVAQSAALHLDEAWGRLTPEEALGTGSVPNPQDGDLTDRAQEAMRRVAEVRSKMRAAERLLKPWVIRHARPDRDARRTTLCGRAIVTNETDISGLEVEGEAVLPFLLAARMQGVLAIDAHLQNRRARAYFAEGLASSFEAYRETRRQQDARSLLDDTAPDLMELSEPMQWYTRNLDRALPAGYHETGRAHPKIAATVERVLELWRSGEKVVVFCFYIATGRSLRHHISAALRDELIALAAPMLALDPTDGDAVLAELERRADRFFDPDAPVTRASRAQVDDILAGVLPSSIERERCIDITLVSSEPRRSSSVTSI